MSQTCSLDKSKKRIKIVMLTRSGVCRHSDFMTMMKREKSTALLLAFIGICLIDCRGFGE